MMHAAWCVVQYVDLEQFGLCITQTLMEVNRWLQMVMHQTDC